MTTFQDAFRKENRERLAAALLRVSIGIMLLRSAWPKVSAIETWPDRMTGFLRFQENTPDWYRGFLDAVVVPNADAFALLVAYGELAAAIALLSGLLTRPALIGSLFMVINFQLAKGTPFWTPSSNDSYLILILLALLFLNSGRFLGVDAWLGRKFPGYKG